MPGIQAPIPSKAASQVPHCEGIRLRCFALMPSLAYLSQPNWPTNSETCILVLCAASREARILLIPTGLQDPQESVHTLPHGAAGTRTRPPASRRPAAGRSPAATQLHDPGVSYGLRIFWPRREHLSGSQRSTSTRQEAPACFQYVCCHETTIPPGITAAAFTQAEPHSYRLAKSSKFRLSSTLR